MATVELEPQAPPASGRAAFGAQPWIADALCRQHPEVDFLIDELRDDPRAAVGICRQCPATEACLDYAISLGASTVGIWGATTGPERAELRRRRRAA